MLKNILYFAVMTIALENLCFSADLLAGPLKADNTEYMQLMQGSRGILDAKGTREQLRYMIDGCITAGITDRLYGNVQQPMASISNFIPQKKLHVLLAYAFYVLGFGNCTEIGQIKTYLGGHQQDIWSNFDREFTALCNLVFNKGTIYQYKNNLEDVIRRTAKGLNFDDFLEERYLTEEEINALQNASKYTYSGIRSQHPDYSPSQVSETIRTAAFPSFVGKFVKKGTVQPVQLTNSSQSPVGMTSQPPSPLTVSTSSSASPRTERYYTDDEIDLIGQPHASVYRKKMSEREAPEAIRGTIKKMSKVINPKYEGE
jgi:hypothetical protein